jgi:hypothetical protein
MILKAGAWLKGVFQIPLIFSHVEIRGLATITDMPLISHTLFKHPHPLFVVKKPQAVQWNA